ncbi:LuxR C-terminal-related transcriptional regulator [Mycolicibacterium sp.]|uniref:LuxR C-terminal-related transcriptional regulator n=1 Tax=Mycolicibacterium sp. TaxID=2320850 RepID=UPI003D1498E1
MTQLSAVSARQASRDLGALLDALTQVRDTPDLSDLLDCAARELCGTGVFDRVMVSHVAGSTWSPVTLYVLTADRRVVVDVDDTGAGVDAFVVPLATPLVEAEVVRRRLPALVRDTADEPRVHRRLIERTGTPEYVVAPVVAGSTVIGLLHADAGTGGRALTELDRDLLRLFADGVAVAYERADLIERGNRQRREVAAACAAALDGPSETWPIGLGPASTLSAVRESATPVGPDRDNAARRDGGRLSRLTAREREVLEILASGATNAQLADRLTVAESTVKSHVKHILHKLGAGNRAAAIACYLRETRDGERRPR